MIFSDFSIDEMFSCPEFIVGNMLWAKLTKIIFRWDHKDQFNSPFQQVVHVCTLTQREAERPLPSRDHIDFCHMTGGQSAQRGVHANDDDAKVAP